MSSNQDSAVAGAVKRGFLVPASELDSQPYGFFYDLDAYRRNMAELRAAFPVHWHHATAVKTNPLASMLSIALNEKHGAECASIGEVIHALAIGFAGPDVVFDCPCKTIPEIRHALENKVMLNIDNMQELGRVSDIVKSMGSEAVKGCVIGLRINPLVGFGAVANLSVSTRKSKFGVICPVEAGDGEERAAVIDALVSNDFINAVHVHTGSGGMTLAQMAEGAAAAANLAIEVNNLRQANQQKIDVIDIGGGLPVAWGSPQSPTFAQYSEELKLKAPSLFDRGVFRRVITEMGAMMSCRYAFFASLCEVTKPTDAGQIAMIHCGSDQFLRACYAPQMRRPHPVKVYDAAGAPKTGEPSLHDVAGPLCFAGDVVVAAAELPHVEVGDIIVLEEAGGNTHSMQTTHCSRRSPPIYGYEEGDDGSGDGLKFSVLGDPTSYEQVRALWKKPSLPKTQCVCQ